MQLPDRNHADKIFLTPRQRNLIGFFGLSMEKSSCALVLMALERMVLLPCEGFRLSIIDCRGSILSR
jgi:hypothetical protein